MSEAVEPERPDAAATRAEQGDSPLVRVEGLTKHFSQGSGLLSSIFPSKPVKAVQDVSFEIERGETLGLVGESGCGKSTLARTILQLIEPSDGAVYFRGENLAELSGERLRRQRRDMQMIFQDPQSSLDPRMKVGPIVEEPMRAHGMPERGREVDRDVAVDAGADVDVTTVVHESADMLLGKREATITVRRRPASEVEERERARYAAVEPTGDGDLVTVAVESPRGRPLSVDATVTGGGTPTVTLTVTAGVDNGDVRERRTRDLLESVGLDPQHYNRYPHQFSGGQRQRINLARALAVNPDFIVCDEPVSALDVSIQAQVLNTMRDLQEEFGLTYLFIAHDLSVIRHICDRVAVMYLGQLVELGDTEAVYEDPQHPYTEALLKSIPVPDPRKSGQRAALEGDVPSPIDPPSGCRFRTRCPKLIAPPEYDMSEEAWVDIRRFMRAVSRRSFEAESPREIHTEFFDGDLPGGEHGAVVGDAIDAILTDDWEEATATLMEGFADKSICAREEPAYDLPTGNGPHFAACHLHRDGAGGA